MEFDYEEEKEFLIGHIKALNKDLLDIEVTLTDALTIAFKDFESRLKTLVNSMKERTGVFFEESQEEVVQFAGKLRIQTLEKAEEVGAYLDAVPDEKKEQELDAKEEDLGKELFEFLVLETREDQTAALESIEDHMMTAFQMCETTITKSLTEDYNTTTEQIS